MPNFDDFIDEFKKDLADLARQFGDDVKDDLLKDGQAFAEKTREDLEKWTAQLASGELSEEDFKWLVKAKKDLAEMEALKQKGLAKAKIDKYRSALLDTVVGSATKLLE